jgi:hypothetical protein
MNLFEFMRMLKWAMRLKRFLSRRYRAQFRRGQVRKRENEDNKAFLKATGRAGRNRD